MDTKTPETATAPIDMDAQLHLFGVDSSSRPTATRFPPAFNPTAKPLWLEVLESPKIKALSKQKASIQWQAVLRSYLMACGAAQVYPFNGKSDFEETSRSFLVNARKQVVKFFAEQGIFQHLKIQSVKRNFSFTESNFIIEVQANLRPIEDPTLERWIQSLPSPGFKKHLDGTYRRSIHAHIDAWFQMDSEQNAVVGYRIFCRTPVRLLEPNLPNRNRLGNYVDKKIWGPIAKEHPFENIGNRNF